jgi:lysophospholipase L1-like esterase
MLGKSCVTLIAMGDSLTAGFMPPGFPSFYVREHPYTDDLRILIDEWISKSGARLDCTLYNLGVNGDTARGMLSRFDQQVAPLEPDYVLVWGGINDLFGAIRPPDIHRDLGRLYERVREIGALPIGCTVTPVLGFDPLIPGINELNAMLRNHCEAEGVALVDLFKATSDASGKLRQDYTSDGVHLNAEGYAKIASTIFDEALKPILSSLSDREA